MWVSFIKNFDWRPKPTVTIAYKSGMRLSVTRTCGEAAIAAGAATAARTPNRKERDAYAVTGDFPAAASAPRRGRRA